MKFCIGDAHYALQSDLKVCTCWTKIQNDDIIMTGKVKGTILRSILRLEDNFETDLKA